jgi:cytidine deaminase
MGRRSRGYARIFDPARPRAVEMDTTTCAHCNGIVHMHDANGKALSGVLVHCHQCDSNICVPCAECARCSPFEKKLEQFEASARLRAQIGVV